jgi:hypothetical protein
MHWQAANFSPSNNGFGSKCVIMLTEMLEQMEQSTIRRQANPYT